MAVTIMLVYIRLSRRAGCGWGIIRWTSGWRWLIDSNRSISLNILCAGSGLKYFGQWICYPNIRPSNLSSFPKAQKKNQLIHYALLTCISYFEYKILLKYQIFLLIVKIKNIFTSIDFIKWENYKGQYCILAFFCFFWIFGLRLCITNYFSYVFFLNE